MPKEAKRRFVGLETDEVSLVDAPANEVEFLVVKNQEDPSMSATATKKEAVRVPLEVIEGEGGDAVAKALEHVSGIVDKISSLVNTRKETKAPKEGDEPTEGGDGDDAEDGDTEETPTEKAASLKSVLEKCGVDTAMAKKVAAAMKAAGFAAGLPSGKKPKPGEEDASMKTKKSTEGDETEEPLTMAALATAVQKAAAFTPQRIKALQNAQDILKLVLEAVTPGTSPDSTVEPVQTHGNPSSVTELTNPKKKPTVPTMKSEEGDKVVELLKSLSTAVGGLVDRVEAIEKARPASNSLGEGGTDTNTKKSGSIWSGVL